MVVAIYVAIVAAHNERIVFTAAVGILDISAGAAQKDGKISTVPYFLTLKMIA